VSRIEARRLSLQLQPVDLVRWLEATVERAGADLANRPRVRIESEPPGPVMVDPVRLEQVVANLLTNAVRYGDPGAPIEVTLRCVRDSARISVSNHGKPIPADELPKLFTRFQRASTADGKPAGLGLGLYISRGLVEAHGGRIWAESGPEAVNVFSFEIPLRLTH
jgi:signal transduction histidine kinase